MHTGNKQQSPPAPPKRYTLVNTPLVGPLVDGIHLQKVEFTDSVTLVQFKPNTAAAFVSHPDVCTFCIWMSREQLWRNTDNRWDLKTDGCFSAFKDTKQPAEWKPHLSAHAESGIVDRVLNRVRITNADGIGWCPAGWDPQKTLFTPQQECRFLFKRLEHHHTPLR